MISFRLRLIVSLLICFVSLSVLFTSCDQTYRNASHTQVSSESIAQGRELAGKYCQSCHALPDPSLLDSKTWEKGVLPQMGPRLGIFEYNYQDYPNNKGDRYLDASYYPSHALLKPQEWQSIIDYYTATSPDSLIIDKEDQKIKNGLRLFHAEVPGGAPALSTTSYIRIHPDSSSFQLVTSDIMKQQVYFFNDKLKAVDSFHTEGAIVDAVFYPGRMLACNIGVLNPNNGKFGKAISVNLSDTSKSQTLLFDSLQRPVQVTATDFNKDGITDYLVCEFGFLTGALSWMEGLPGQHFQKHVLRPVPGAIKAYINDYNHDGLPDIWVLFAQADESIYLFTNKGHGNFSEERLLTFPPVYGSSYFELADFNKDGHPDILYTCGDNADYSTVLKPYHGVYIYMNDGSNHFKQSYFFHINGCYKAMARDFDHDGDLDIATIAYFADYQNRPEEGFVYLENQGNFHFIPSSLQETQQGRWLTMDAGDYDGDGKTDIILGNFMIGPGIKKSKTDWSKSPPFLLLRNTGIHN